jgi:glycosyltransferase involved in cell wall biosynthesis
MTIAIDGTSLLLPSAGVRNYLHYWVESLMEAAPGSGDKIRIYPFFGAGAPASLLDHRRASGGSMAAFVGLNLARFINIRGNPALDFAALGADLFHCSQHMARRPRRCTATATIFDLSCWTVPGMHTPANVAATRRYADNILKTCDGLIAISASARNDAVEILRIPADRIRVIYPGVAEPFFQVTGEQADAIKARYKLNAPYFLFVGCIEPRKNVPNIVLAWQRLPKSLRKDIQLVLAGPFGWASEAVRRTLAEAEDDIRYLGYVPEADLPGLVRGAVALLYPSWYEGFGLPAAQAMAAGVPVIASDRASLPEVVGDGGLLVNPDSVDELCHAMNRIATCPELRGELGARGKSRADAFRWPECAARSLEFFHDVGNG